MGTSESVSSVIEKEDGSETLGHLLKEVTGLRTAVAAGDLKWRMKSEGRGAEAKAICGILNEVLDNIVGTYERAVTSVDGMCTGRIPEPFQDGFPGDFARAKQVCNSFIDVINRRNAQIRRMTEAAALGDLRVRANVSEFTGANRRIFEGFNAMFDAWLAPVEEIEHVLTALARMDLTARVEGKYAGDYGSIAVAANAVCSNLAEEVRKISEHTRVMASASGGLAGVAREMAAGADETSRKASSAEESSESVSARLSEVSAGSAEMVNSIREISRNASRAAGVVQSAVNVSANTTEKMSHLGQASAEISKVIKVITGIAQQTNLLALNATIEAARAGEAGKGFAVVANEVKELAKDTARATDEVSRAIEGIQRETRESIDGITAISSVTSQIHEISDSIAAAVEEQTATTNAMGNNVSEAAATASGIANQMRGLAEAARNTSNGARQTQSAISELEKILSELRRFVDMFKV